MPRSSAITRSGAGAIALACAAASCGGGNAGQPTGGPFLPDAAIAPVAGPCLAARASEDLTPRSELTGMSGAVAGGTLAVKTTDLFARFRAICGDCHVAQSNGQRHVDEASFATTFDASWLVPVKSNDPKLYMPPAPGGKPFEQRSANDPVVTMVTYLEAWLEQGRPRTTFTIDAASVGVNGSSGYLFTPDVAATMTNLGNCVPDATEVARSPSGVMESLDQLFTDATVLPQSLADTDLTSFDSAVLAQTGVIAYVPTYPLWSDGSGKLRHIRVPKGESVRFDKAAQTFDIPANTRFYKTFFRKVIDRTGHVRNRKMETRLIVSRPDTMSADGTAQQNALFGTYIWSEDETTALLANLTYRDGTTHADQVRAYITDELAYQSVVESVGPGADFQAQLELALGRALEDNPGLERHYAIPGRIRCVQCHMGSPTKDFVLGFFPLQVARRADGTGGTYEPTGADELNQLQRLVDYGVITGVGSPDDLLPLEKSQGARKARTDGELNAQAYMVGNCAHCHNPRGFPSISKPELATVLDFLPSTTGGVFEMPLERMSPVRARGANGDVAIPYITPSLYDYPVADDKLKRLDNGVALSGTIEGQLTELTWSPKYDSDNGHTLATEQILHQVGDCAADNEVTRGYCGSRKTGLAFILAPWRSLIYRNVDSPFPYFDDYVPFPHMPMNTPGFDCRAPRIMGEWMVGLPAVRKHPEIPEYWLPQALSREPGSYDPEPQPYREVRPGELDEDGIPRAYEAALAAAAARVAEYRASPRYSYCQDDLGADIYDPVLPLSGTVGYLPDTSRFTFGGRGDPVHDPHDRTTDLPRLGVPFHSHWFNYDPTDSPPPWSPRRPDWNQVLPPGSQPDTSVPAGGFTLTPELARERRLVIAAIRESQLTSAVTDYATKELPFGIWQEKPECLQKLAGAPKVSDFAGKRPAWMDKANPDPNAHVYMASPGAMLYRHICFNCHGPRADGHGLQADALAASSDGEAQPANFREGLFGPSTQPGSNLAGAFVVPGSPDVDAAGWGARYMAWMALGGTLKIIPENIIKQVQATRVMGQVRRNLQYLSSGQKQASANMLNLAKGICSSMLPNPREKYYDEYKDFNALTYPPFNATPQFTPLIDVNGDKELWLELCNRFSPPVVRVYEVVEPTRPHVQLTSMYYAQGDATHDGFPANAPVLDHTRAVRTGVQADNYYPACIKQPTDPTGAAWLAGQDVVSKHHMPDCPVSFLANGKLLWKAGNLTEEYEDNVARWALRGGVATGMTVFSYLRAGGAQMTVKPYYNECQLLK